MEIRPIRTNEDYDAAIARIDQLIDSEPGTAEYDELDVLSTLVWAYEEEHYPVLPPDPISAIEFHVENHGMTRRDLEPFIGRRPRVSEILNRKRPLTLTMIRKLEEGLGIPAEILVQPYPLDSHASSSDENTIWDDTNTASRYICLPQYAWHALTEQARQENTTVDRLAVRVVLQTLEVNQQRERERLGFTIKPLSPAFFEDVRNQVLSADVPQKEQIMSTASGWGISRVVTKKRREKVCA